MRIGSTLISNLVSKKTINVLLALLGLLTLTLVIFSRYIPFSITWKPGDLAKQTIVSPRYLTFESIEDKKKTEELRKKRVTLVEPIFSIDEEINKSIIANIVSFFTTFKSYKSAYKQNPNTNIPEILSFISDADLHKYAQLNTNALSSIEYLTVQNTERITRHPIREINIETIRTDLANNLKILALPRYQIELINKVILNYLKINTYEDKNKTEELTKEEIASIKPFTTTYKEGQPVIYVDEVVTPLHIEVMKQLNMYGLSANIYKFIGIMLISLFCFILLERFIYYFNPKIKSISKYFVMIYFVILIIVVIGRLLQLLEIIPQHLHLEYLIPIPIASMIISLLITPNISLLCGTIISILIGLIYQGDFTLFLYLFLSNCVTTFATHKKYKRADLMVTGYTVGAFNILFVVIIGLFKEINDILWFASNVSLGFLNGIFSAMISLAILPYFETLFKITTPQTLLELSNLNHPLLKRLMVTAPGTYQHSLMVANLSEAAAEAIKADVVLSRVGAYFHDIGKMKRPMFFSENQFSNGNPHSSMSPRLSKLIIAAHTKDGVEMATKYKLPEILKKIMLEHHGTTLVSFFFSQAIAEEDISETESISLKESFRYSGPRPSFKESGIIMLADSVEAAVRSLDKPSIQKIESLIDKIISDKIDDHQLDNCPITLKEISTIRDTFLKIFRSIYHHRLDYEEELDNIIEQTKLNSGDKP